MPRHEIDPVEAATGRPTQWPGLQRLAREQGQGCSATKSGNHGEMKHNGRCEHCSADLLSDKVTPELNDCILGATVLRVTETADFNVIEFSNRFVLHAPKPSLIVHPDFSSVN